MITTEIADRSGSSFRDPAGYIFEQEGLWKRAVTPHGITDYQQLISSGLYDSLVKDALLVSHLEEPAATSGDIARILVPEQIPHISYPYEWSFGQLRDAGLLTLEIQRRALEHGMSLKDASAFNVQFRGPEPVFIDTLSFERNDGGPWPAYSQFCRHFLAPLLLMSTNSPSFNQFLRTSLDGFPLDVASRLLPATSWLNFGTLLHIHLHARSQQKYAGNSTQTSGCIADTGRTDPKPGFVSSLKNLVSSIKLKQFQTEW